METSRSPFGALLYHYRTRAGLTQEQLAAHAKMGTSTISALERGLTRSPRAATVQLLTEALALSPAETVVFQDAARECPAVIAAPPLPPGIQPLIPPKLTWRASIRGSLLIGMLLTTLVGVLVGLMSQPAQPPPVFPADGRLWLESRRVDNRWTNNPARGRHPLAAGQSFGLIVTGTMSVWPGGQWAVVCKGHPLAAPLYPSAGFPPDGRINGPVGLDAAFMFAAPANTSYCSYGTDPPIASLTPFIVSLDGGSTWLQLKPDPPEYNPRHVYAYQVQGQGFPMEVRVQDFNLADNYGMFLLEIVARSP